MFDLASLVSSLGSHLAYSSSDVTAEVRCVGRASHGGESPRLRGIDTYHPLGDCYNLRLGHARCRASTFSGGRCYV